ncbi:MAG: hypothetical protein AB7H80_13465 [Candidatus Kapaibacterium sp.]
MNQQRYIESGTIQLYAIWRLPEKKHRGAKALITPRPELYAEQLEAQRKKS